ncbi:MAG: CBS domain-containing protein [Syntrophobacteraceae bacterium]|nr:CBS domain-containing protein [Desulfobacteraceae bacterium]
MDSAKVKELMVPLPQYALVSEDASLYEAVLALEEAQRRFSPERARHRSILVIDRNNRVVGKVDMWDILRGIEPRYRELGIPGEDPDYSPGSGYISAMLKTYGLWRRPLEDMCGKAGIMNVREIMHPVHEAQYIGENSPVEEAIHQLLMGRHQSLLVTRGDDVVGILRLSDVFEEIGRHIKSSRN